MGVRGAVEVQSLVSNDLSGGGYLLTFHIFGRSKPLTREHAEVLQAVMHHVLLDRYEGRPISSKED